MKKHVEAHNMSIALMCLCANFTAVLPLSWQRNRKTCQINQSNCLCGSSCYSKGLQDDTVRVRTTSFPPTDWVERVIDQYQ